MANVNITVNGTSKALPTGKTGVAALLPAAHLGGKLIIPALNMKFSCNDSITINGGEVITTSLP